MPYEEVPEGSAGTRGLPSAGDSGEVAAVAAAAESFPADWLKGDTDWPLRPVFLWHEEQPTARGTRT